MTSAFALAAHPSKAAADLIAADDAHFAAIAESLDHAVADLEERLDAARRAPGGHGQQALDRDQEVRRLSTRLRTLRRFSLDLCLGRMVPADGGAPVYVGRLGLSDRSGRRLLVDWRTPAAEPFFAATPARPEGLRSRRRYRWSAGRVADYWDESFDGRADGLALDDDSAFVASLGASRSPRMRDVLGTLQADQDAIIRASSRGALVVDGGPGTGKTVVALHRAAYLLHADPRLGEGRGGVLFVGPHRPYLSYVADVLPSLGEDGVRTCTLRDLLPEGERAREEADPAVARLKQRVDLVAAVEAAARFYEEPPAGGLEVETPWVDLWLGVDDWAEAFAAAGDLPHNDARDEVWEALVAILVDKSAGVDVAPEQLRRSLAQHEGLVDAFGGAWPRIGAADLVGDLWSVPAFLRHCAPGLSPDEVRLLQRPDPQAWTVADLPILDAARRRLGDPEASRRRRRQEAASAARREEMDRVVDHLVATDDSEMLLMSMLRVDDLSAALEDEEPVLTPDELAGPFAHVVVDEAQELTDAEWQMLLLRCPSRSFTIVGDRAQARRRFAESWRERLARVGIDRVTEATLTVNYRTPAEVMAEAEPVVRAVVPDANVPTSIRSSGLPVVHGAVADLDAVVDGWLAEHAEGTVCVIGATAYAERPRVRSLTPETAKGLEFDLVVLVGPASWDAVDRYVAMTRATGQLVVLEPPVRGRSGAARR